ncbi:hypothetical protein BJ085DRAFT_32253 [Dimargaris cristalligena]|uniref:Uncharacterized protein n=1 Tax=Dimargaris cristalligena TaxID=215637 RepID=A0A4Q0A062_9FUNG|nr:hypothetical protein BJ085DRAFT_32253 [Dimargaris cristalligena]|eukprot:RKP38811.1 hypothetical protein BJ085DRAFT_32253 [Dimargaris cristalligena]
MAHFFDRSSCGSPDPPLPGKSLITPPPSKGSASKVKSYLADGSAFPSLTNAISFGSPSGALPTHSSALPALPPFDYSTRPHLPSDPFSHIMSSPTSDAYHDPAHYPSSDSESTTYSSSFRSPPQSFRRISHSGRPSDLDLILNPVAEEPLSSSFQDYSFFDSRPSSRDLTPLPEETDPDTSMELATSPYTPTLPHRGPFRAEFAFSERDYPPTASGPSAFGPSSLPPPPNFFTRYGQVERPLKTARTAASDSEMGSAEPNHPPFSPPRPDMVIGQVGR